MTIADPVSIVRKALAKGELAKLLVGAPEYRYLPKWSPAPGNTDLAALIGALYDQTTEDNKEHICNEMVEALNAIVNTYEGLEPVAACLLLESLRKVRKRSPFGLPLEDLAARLRKSISAFAERLEADKTEIDASYQNGRLGELQRLSRNTVDLGGPSFW